jgi:hypothetical protein
MIIEGWLVLTMRRHENYEEKSNVFQVKFIIPLIIILLGFFAFNFLTKDRTPELPADQPPLVENDESPETLQAGPVPVVDDESGTWLSNPMSADAADLSAAASGAAEALAEWRDRVKQFGFQSGAGRALRRSVEKYGTSSENQCSGNIVVRTNDTPLNIRSGPAVSNSVVGKAKKDAAYDVLMWANDEVKNSGRWFLLVDSNKKVVLGWVSGEYCDAAGVSFPN